MYNDKEKYLQEEILKALKDGKRPHALAQDETAEAYQLLFDALSEEEDLKIPGDFAESAAKAAVKKTKLSLAIHSALLYTVPVILLLALSFSSLFFLSKETFNTLNYLGRLYGQYIAFAVAIITLVQLADRWFVSKRTSYPFC